MEEEPRFRDFTVYTIKWMEELHKSSEDIEVGKDKVFKRASFENYGLCFYGNTIRYVFPWHTIKEVMCQVYHNKNDAIAKKEGKL